MAIADELIALLGFDLRGEDQARRYEQLLDQVNRRLDQMVVAAGRVAGYAALAVAGGMAVMGRSIINTSAQFETFEATLTTIEGSSEKARESLDWISDFAKTTPFEVAGITDAFVKLKAYGIDPVADDALRTLGDTAAAMGKPLEAAVEMFADASSMEFERLKEFGVRATQAGDEVTFAWTENGETLTRTMKKNGDEVRAFILENLGQRFSGAMDRQSRTYSGMMSNLGDSWTDFQRRIGDSGLFGAVTDHLRSLLDLIGRLDADGSLDRWAQNISDALTTVMNVLWFLGARFASNALFIGEHWESLKGYVIGVAAAVGLLIARAFPLITALTVVALVIDDIIAYMQGSESVIGAFVDWFTELTGVSDGVAVALAGVAGTVGTILAGAFLLTPMRVMRLFSRLLVTGSAAAFARARVAMLAGVIRWGPGLQAALTGLKVAVKAGISAALFLLTNPIGWAILLAGAAAGLIWYFWDDLVVAWEGLRDQAVALFTQLKDWVLSIDWLGLGVSMIQAIFEGLKTAGGAIRDWFMGLFDFNWGDVVPPPPTPQELGYDPTTLYGTPGANPTGAETEALRNYLDNTNRMSSESSGAGALGDRNDNRTISQTTHVEVNQTVTQASDAPRAAADATGAAVSRRAASMRSQLETEPSF